MAGAGAYSAELCAEGRGPQDTVPLLTPEASQEKLLGTSATLVVTSALLVVTRSY